MEQYVTGPVDVVVFNLGWLPGGDHTITTHVGSTLDALNAALRLIKPGGLITVCAYPGHAEGACELEAVTNWASALDGRTYQAMVRRYIESADERAGIGGGDAHGAWRNRLMAALQCF